VISDPNNSQAMSDPQSPESRIARLLLVGNSENIEDITPFTDPNSTQSFKNHLSLRQGKMMAATATEEEQWIQSQQLSQIETLLMLGRREEAVKIAIEIHNWSLAILISSVCDKSTYQDVIRAYSEYMFPRTSGLNLLTHIYSNQAENMIRHGGKVLGGLSGGAGGSHAAPSASEAMWARNLAAVISNKVDDWSTLARHIGDRVLQESGVCLSNQRPRPPPRLTSSPSVTLRMSLLHTLLLLLVVLCSVAARFL
jgi:hypothetical protein